MRKVLIAPLLFIAVAITLPGSGQAPREVLTNAKILELVRMGSSEALIVAKIKRSDCQCDTSIAAIAKLKAAGVGDAVIIAMIDATPEVRPGGRNGNSPAASESRVPRPKAEPVDTEPSSAGSAALGRLTEPGIYLFEDNEMQAIEPSVFSGSKVNPLMSGLTYGIKTSKFKAKVRGRSANLHTSPQPVFYFVFNPEYKNSGATMAGNMWFGLPATSPNEFMLVQMSVEEASRQAVLGEYGVWTGMKTGARDKDVREYSFEKIKPGIYRVVPKAALTPGEYCFYYAGNVTGFGFAGGKIFDFSVK